MRRTVVSAFATLLAAASLTLSAYAQSSTAFTDRDAQVKAILHQAGAKR